MAEGRSFNTSDAMEAIIGSIYLGGIDEATIIMNMLMTYIRQLGELLWIINSSSGGIAEIQDAEIQYKLIDSRSDHLKIFTVSDMPTAS